jgi:hypothetical protein
MKRMTDQSMTAPAGSDSDMGERAARPLCILVLGMHRSGTSVLTGLLGLLGVSLPKNLMPPSSDNLKGYFEPDDIVTLHNEMLVAFGSSWSDVRPLVSSVFASTTALPFKVRIAKALNENFGDSKLYVVKDPRICRLVPLWRDIIVTLGAELSFVSVIRNPLEVAYSLAQRNQLPIEYSLNLWLRHVLDAEFQTRGQRRTFVRYADLMRDWKRVIDELQDKMGIPLSTRTAEIQNAVAALIDEKMRHHQIGAQTLAIECRNHPLILKAYDALEKLVGRSDDAGAIKSLDDVREEFERAISAFGLGSDSPLFAMQSNLDIEQFKSNQVHDEYLRVMADLEVQTKRVTELEDQCKSALDQLTAAKSRLRELENALQNAQPKLAD